MKKIFSSQGNLDLGRNRPQRRLEAELDKEESIDCQHKKYCPLPKFSMKCIFNRDSCRSFHFYNKYGEDANYLGVGS